MTEFLANAIFYGAMVSFLVLVYQSAILPGIRQNLRFDLFRLRDDLRRLVIEKRIAEADQAFVLLHDNLNFMCANLPRFELMNAIKVVRTLNGDDLERVRAHIRVLDNSIAEVQKIYHASVNVFIWSVVVNSLFLFLGLSIVVVIVTGVRVGLTELKDALIRKAEEEAKLVFFRSAQVAV